MKMSNAPTTSPFNNGETRSALPNPGKIIVETQGEKKGIMKGLPSKHRVHHEAKPDLKRRVKTGTVPPKKRTKVPPPVMLPVRPNWKKTPPKSKDSGNIKKKKKKHERSKDEKNFLNFVDTVCTGSAATVKTADNKEVQTKPPEKPKEDTKSLSANEKKASLPVAADVNAASQNQGLQDLQLLQEMRKKALSQTASQEAEAQLLQAGGLGSLGGMGGLMAQEQSQSLAAELREAQLRQESLQRLLAQQQAATSLGGQELFQGGLGLDNLSTLQLLQQQQQQRETAEYAQLLSANSSLAPAGALSALASDVDPALLLRAKLAQSSVADPELLLRLNALNSAGAGSAGISSLASGMGHLAGAESRLSQLQALSGLNSGLLPNGALGNREALDYMMGLNQASLLRASEPTASSDLSLSSLMPGLDAGSSLAGAQNPALAGLSPELRAALLQNGSSFGALQHMM